MHRLTKMKTPSPLTRPTSLEMVEKVRFGFEVGEERAVGNASFFGYACCRRTQPLRDDDARRRL